MEQSPKRRRIERLKGDAGTITARGNEITRLGDQMLASADLLERIAGGTAGQKGLAVDQLEDVVGDVHRELRRAGEMYRPTGPVVAAYGRSLAEVKPRLDAHVANCEEYWSTYVGLPGFRADQRPVWGAAKTGTPEADTEAETDRDKEAAYETWRDEAARFDASYDTWEDAFDQAANGIGDVLDGKIEDEFWDKADGFVAGALEVLKWVGLALTIAAVIIGGPLIAALAAVVAVTALLLTIYQKTRGDAGWKDVIMASIGVIPFGSLGKLGKVSFVDDMLGGLVTGAGRSKIFTEVSTIWGSGRSAFQFTGSFAQGGGNFFAHALRNHGNDGRLVDSISRFFTGKAAGAIGSAKPADILVAINWTQLSRLNTGLSWGTGQGLWSRVYDGVTGDR